MFSPDFAFSMDVDSKLVVVTGLNPGAQNKLGGRPMEIQMKHFDEFYSNMYGQGMRFEVPDQW